MRKRNLPLRWEVGAVLLITLIAAAPRFYRLPDLPPGLHFDEGFKGITARGLLEGAPPQIFFESDMGEEPIAHYLVAAAIGLLGQKPWVIRLPSALAGVLTVPLAWWLGRELFQNPRSHPGGAIPGRRTALQGSAAFPVQGRFRCGSVAVRSPSPYRNGRTWPPARPIQLPRGQLKSRCPTQAPASS